MKKRDWEILAIIIVIAVAVFLTPGSPFYIWKNRPTYIFSEPPLIYSNSAGYDSAIGQTTDKITLYFTAVYAGAVENSSKQNVVCLDLNTSDINFWPNDESRCKGAAEGQNVTFSKDFKRIGKNPETFKLGFILSTFESNVATKPMSEQKGIISCDIEEEKCELIQ